MLRTRTASELSLLPDGNPFNKCRRHVLIIASKGANMVLMPEFFFYCIKIFCFRKGIMIDKQPLDSYVRYKPGVQFAYFAA